MKNSHLLLASIFMLTQLLYADTDQIQQDSQSKIKAASLQATCSINIMKETLSYANKEKNFNPDEFSSTFKKLYDECNTFINNSEQSKLSENAWLNKKFREINTLQKDNETRNCLNQAMIQLKEFGLAATQDEKDIIIKNFFQNAENCYFQQVHRLSLSELEAHIAQWEKSEENKDYYFTLLNILIKHTPDEKYDLLQDLQELHNKKFNAFAHEIQSQISKIKNDPHDRQCLENIIKFKKMYDATQTPEEKEHLKKDFAIPYFQCKNK